ncbi:MAG: Gfo/Idh/MocA family oxidoreductase, partial [Candidatus Bathyarchaeia archaeon]
MKPIGLGIIGCGVIGTRHMLDASESPWIKLVAVADLIEEKARKAAEQFGAKKTYFSGDDLLDDPEVDAVVLAFPTKGRTRLGLQAFAKGKHVLTEKPVAMNSDEVRQLIAARGDLIAGCCSCRFRLNESAEKATDFIKSGGLGDLRALYCRVFNAAGEKPKITPPEWRLKKELNGGGILVNWGCYDMDYLLGLTSWSLKPKS